MLSDIIDSGMLPVMMRRGGKELTFDRVSRRLTTKRSRLSCAATLQVLEETGYDASEGANEKDFLSLYLHGQQTTMYIVSGVDEDFAFEPQVRVCMYVCMWWRTKQEERK